MKHVQRYSITIETTASWNEFLKRMIATILLIPIPVALGFYYGSEAAQFIGLFLGFVLLMGHVQKKKEDHTVSNFDDARKLIAELEREHNVPPVERT